jgi:hypothetical protein
VKRNAKQVWLILILFCLAAVPSFATPRPCALPGLIGGAVGEEWRGWRLMELGDLRSDDQTLWQEHPSNRQNCPGLNQGKFDGEHTGFVFTLVRGSDEQVVLIGTPDASSYKITTLVPPTKVAYFSVVNVFPPGTYKDLDTDKRVRIPTVSAALVAIESSIKLFYLNEGKWKSILISD